MSRRFGFGPHGLEWIADAPNITAGSPAQRQIYYRIRDDSTALNTSGGWLTTENQTGSLSRGTGTTNRFRIRFTSDEINNKIDTLTPQLYVSKNSGAYARVDGSSSNVRATGAIYADGATTSQLLSSAPAGAFVAGRADDVDGATVAISYNKDEFSEIEFSVYIVDADVSNGDTLDFRVYNAGVALSGGYATNATPRVTVSKSANVSVEIPVGSLTATGQVPTPTLSDNQVVVVPTGSITAGGAAAVTPDTWDEQFEGTGFEETWSEGITEGVGGSVDEDYATSSVTGAPADWDSQCCQFVMAAAGDSDVEHRGIGTLTVAYARAEIIVESSSLVDGDRNAMLLLLDSTGQYLMLVDVENVSGTNYLALRCYHDGASNVYYSDNAISLDTRYRVELYWNSTADEWEWRVDGVTQDSGSLTSTATGWTVDRIRIGGTGSGSDGAITYYLDNVGIDITEWPGSAAGAGLPPTVDLAWQQTIPVGTLALTGLVPTVSTSAAQAVEVPTGTVTLAGQVPTPETTDVVVVTVPAGAVVLTGHAAAIELAWSQVVPAGAVAVTGYAPTVAAGANVAVEVPAGALTTSTFVPSISTSDHQAVEIPAGSIAAAGYAPAPALAWEQTIPAGSLAVTGQQPSVTTGGNVEVVVPAGSLAFTGQSPTIANPAGVTVPAGAASLTGLVPTANTTAHVDVEIPAASMTLAGQVPTVTADAGVSVTVPTGSITAAGLAPDLELEWSGTVPVGTALLTGYAPTVSTSATQQVEIPAGSLALTGFAPTVTATANQVVTVPAAALGLSGYAPTLGLAWNQTIPAGAVTLAGLVPDAYAGLAPDLELPLELVFAFGRPRAHMTRGEHTAEFTGNVHRAHFDSG